jgi:hypothetical protein
MVSEPRRLPQQAHGTLGSYVNDRCRCDECRAAWAAYHREYRARRAAARKAEAEGGEAK